MKSLNKQIADHFKEMCKSPLFRVDVDGNTIAQLYLDGFNKTTFRDPATGEYECRNCTNFLRRYGNVVCIKGNTVISLWDIIPVENVYSRSIQAMRDAVKSAKIKGFMMESYDFLKKASYESFKGTPESYRIGVKSNNKQYTKDETQAFPGTVVENRVYTFNHFYANLPGKYVTKYSVPTVLGELRSKFDVFERSMREFNLEHLELVIDLINQGSILNGTPYLPKLNAFVTFKKTYDSLPNSQRVNWCWVNCNIPIAKFKNELMGVFVTELGTKELDVAVRNWNKRVDPVNFMKAKAPFTKGQYEKAVKFLMENGYTSAFNRRHATFEDIRAEMILHMNEERKEFTIFDSISPVSNKKLDTSKLTEVNIDEFMKTILPRTTSLEVYLENRHEGNLVNLTTSIGESKNMFNYGNSFSRTYKGNLAGKSMIAEAVKAQGGNVDGVLRFSIMWSEGNSNDNSDLDAHCREPNGNLIYYANKTSNSTSGFLDIDITGPLSHKRHGKDVVENIAHSDLSKMPDGEYDFFVNQYSERGSTGFKAEIAFGGEIFNYDYNHRVLGKIHVATVTKKGNKFTIEHKLPHTNVSRELWSLNTKDFHKVQLVSLGPNHWDTPVGNKEYMFFLEGCRNPESTRGYHNVDFNSELKAHRKVLEPLGAKNLIPFSEDQLAGLGFNATVRDELVVKVTGSHTRMLKIKF